LASEIEEAHPHPIYPHLLACPDEEDWNVYDDFNNTRPLSGTPTQPTGIQESESAGYWDRRSQDGLSVHKLARDGSSPLGTPYSDNPNKRASLLPSSSFGFDAKNGDPRNSMFSQGDSYLQSTPYHDHGPISPDERNHNNKDLNASGIELITVPALGQEYSQEEMRKMTRPYKRKSKAGSRKKRVKAGASKFAGGEWKICGWLSPRVAVFMAFVFLAA